jgi:hypothetical protein
MKEDAVAHVTRAGDITGDYLVDERLDDGRRVLRPDTDADAIVERTGGGPRLTPEEFEQDFGRLPADDEG